MNLVVIDLEWNTKARSQKVDPKLAEQMMFEIIEIGAVKLDRRGRVIDRFSERVQPVLYKHIQRHVAAVTQRTQQSLSDGVPFPDVFHAFRAFAGEDPILVSWGTSDAEVFISNMRFHDVAPWRFRAMDAQAFFSHWAESGSSRQQRSVEYALDFLRLDKDLPFHKASSDAEYAARILVETIRPLDDGIDVERRLKPFIYDPWINQQTKTRLPLDPSGDVAAYLTQQTYACPACERPLHGTWRVIRKGKRWFAKARCPEHGDIELSARRVFRVKPPQVSIRVRIPKGPLREPTVPSDTDNDGGLVWVDGADRGDDAASQRTT